MPSLHETYATLLRRGMPPHGLVWYTTDYEGSGTFYWVLNGDPCGVDPARDLIEAHARRWWLGLKLDNATREIRILDGHVIAFEITEQDEFVFGAGMVGSGHTTLDALIAATAHLEPKQTPPATS